VNARYVPAEEQLVLELFVGDAVRSRDFYAALGFEVVRDSGTFVVLAWDGHLLLLDQRTGLRPAPSPVANVRVLVPDVDAAWERVKALALRIVVPIADRAYGLRDFTVADPDGFGVRFASRIGGDKREAGT